MLGTFIEIRHPIFSRSALSFPLYNPILHIPSRYGDIRGSPLGPKDLEADQVRKLSDESGFPC